MSLDRYRQGHPNMFKMFFDDMITKDSYNEQQRPSNAGALPASNIKESNEAFVIEMVAPGLEKSDFSITIDKMKLTVAVNKEEEKALQSEKYRRKEFHYFNFKRSFQLSKSVNIENISADYTQGILALKLPKMNEAVPEAVRQVQVG